MKIKLSKQQWQSLGKQAESDPSVEAAQKRAYVQSEINAILEPDTEYKYQIKISNGATGASTKYITVPKSVILAIANMF